jgi:hypothetical protein
LGARCAIGWKSQLDAETSSVTLHGADSDYPVSQSMLFGQSLQVVLAILHENHASVICRAGLFEDYFFEK